MKLKAEYMEKHLNISFDPCEDFANYAAYNLNSTFIKSLYLEKAKHVLQEHFRPNEPKSIQKAREIYHKCLKDMSVFNTTLSLLQIENIISELPVQFPIGIEQIKDDEMYLGLVGKLYNLLYSHVAGPIDDYTMHLESGDLFITEVHKPDFSERSRAWNAYCTLRDCKENRISTSFLETMNGTYGPPNISIIALKKLIKTIFEVDVPLDGVRIYLFTPVDHFSAHSSRSQNNYIGLNNFEFPQYDVSFPPMLTLSGPGFTMAHELGHAFGSRVENRSRELNETLHCFESFYENQCDPINSTNCVDSAKTIEENFADQMAVHLSYFTYKKSSLINGYVNRPRGKILDILTDDQLFFINLAQSMAPLFDWDNITSDDRHSPSSTSVYGYGFCLLKWIQLGL
uniref:Peptidase_M13 domain-containing protein n=1 Tax=Bursaphelenchus xylophilus TaxID=6326 RepID=A0A1I7SSQ7_BURXY